MAPLYLARDQDISIFPSDRILHALTTRKHTPTHPHTQRVPRLYKRLLINSYKEQPIKCDHSPTVDHSPPGVREFTVRTVPPSTLHFHPYSTYTISQRPPHLHRFCHRKFNLTFWLWRWWYFCLLEVIPILQWKTNARLIFPGLSCQVNIKSFCRGKSVCFHSFNWS